MPQISEETYKMLADIFRLMLREVTTDEDKDKLAPGELGISYKEGAFYIKDPHTGELFSPNSLEHIKQILSKYDNTTNILNADRVSGLRFYTSLDQVPRPAGGSAMTTDTIIRQLESLSFAILPIDEDSYEVLNYPAKTGIMEIKKLSPTDVKINFIDTNTYTEYTGKYNPFKKLFEGWSTTTGTSADYTESGGTSDEITATVPNKIKDLSIITLRLTKTANPGATIAVNDIPACPIVDKNGKPLSSSIDANNIIMLVRNELKNQWILMDSTESTTEATLSVMNIRMSELQDALTSQRKEYINLIKLVRDRLDTEPGNIITVTSVYTAQINGITNIPVKDFIYGVDKLIVNFSQTILRPDIDYITDTDGSIMLKNGISLSVGDTIQFIVLKQTKK